MTPNTAPLKTGCETRDPVRCPRFPPVHRFARSSHLFLESFRSPRVLFFFLSPCHVPPVPFLMPITDSFHPCLFAPSRAQSCTPRRSPPPIGSRVAQSFLAGEHPRSSPIFLFWLPKFLPRCGAPCRAMPLGEPISQSDAHSLAFPFPFSLFPLVL